MLLFKMSTSRKSIVPVRKRTVAASPTKSITLKSFRQERDLFRHYTQFYRESQRQTRVLTDINYVQTLSHSQPLTQLLSQIKSATNVALKSIHSFEAQKQARRDAEPRSAAERLRVRSKDRMWRISQKSFS